MHRWRGRIPLFMVMVILLCATPTQAADIAATFTLTGGALSETPVASSVTVNATLGGTATFAIGVVVTDNRGTGTGWHLTATSTPFAPASGASFPADASVFTGASATCVVAGTCTLPNNSAITYSNLIVPAATTPPLAVPFFSAAASTGTGAVNVAATMRVTIPANASRTNYTSTFILDIASGP